MQIERINNLLSAARATAVLGALIILANSSHAQSVSVYVSAPGVQETHVAGAQTEDFEELPIGLRTENITSTIGTYVLTGTASISPTRPGESEHGGAYKSKFLTIGAQSNDFSPYTLQLNSQANYFGFWWSAGDHNNRITLLYGDIELVTVSTQDILDLLGNTTVTAVDNTVYVSEDYKRNPNLNEHGGQYDTTQPFAYVHLFTAGVTFDRIRIWNNNTNDTGFESDNHSVHLLDDTAPRPTGPTVFVTEVPSQVPEPGTTAMLAAAGGAFLFRMLKRRRTTGA